MDVKTFFAQHNQNGKVKSEIKSDQNNKSEIKHHHNNSNSTFNPMFIGIIVIYAITL